ncbi:hypothetical protein [Candidatus Odyssella acanthamoebae]|uniref:hypothetical protein n=1 Tax=Candidatus Odyssella acanthamoebae TaxID=91604 RepID=UPI00068CBAE9|nr:hypothetical protein [Candidatus Paracaedibacter acanthamoebae]
MAPNSKSEKEYAKDYTQPHLRQELKEKIKASSKGGKKGQWSARKSQLLTKEYEATGGGYKHKGKLAPSQRSLKKWTSENWQTEKGDKAQQGDRTQRYLPKKVWNRLTDAEKKETNKLKIEASQKGQQYVSNPSSVKKKRKSHKFLLCRVKSLRYGNETNGKC